jgi:nucleoside-diphosphate-sugar epimerase
LKTNAPNRPEKQQRVAPSVSVRAEPLFKLPEFELPNFQLPSFDRASSSPSPSSSPSSAAGARTVFVAGATGRLGARVVRSLLAADEATRVRAGVRDAAAATAALRAAARNGLLSPAALRRVDVVTCNLETAGVEAIAAALRGCDVVVQAIGASETSADLSAPARIDGDASIALVRAAELAKVQHFVMVTSLGTGKTGFPASALNLFGGILTQKRRAEVALENSSIPRYTIVRPGGLERPRDDHGETHSVVAACRDSTFGGQLSRAQVAGVIAAAVADPEASGNRCVELFAVEGAARAPYRDLLACVPADEGIEERLARVRAAAALEAARVAAGEASRLAAEAAAEAAEAAGSLAAVSKRLAPALATAVEAQRAVDAAAARSAKAREAEAAAKAALGAARAAAAAAAAEAKREKKEKGKEATTTKRTSGRESELEAATTAAAAAAAAEVQKEEMSSVQD